MNKKSIWNKNYIFVLIINILTAFSFHILTPTIPKYVISIGNGAAIAGFVSTAFTITSILTRPVAGYYVDTKRKKNVLFLAMVIISISIFGYAMSHNVALIIFFRLLHGIGWGMATTATSTVAVTSLPEDMIGRGLGLFGIASSLASVFAPNLGLHLIESVGYFSMFMIAFSLAVGAGLLSFLIDEASLRKPETVRSKENILSRLFDKRATLPAIVILSVGIGMASITNFIAVYAEEIHVENIGYYFTVAGAVMLFMRPMFGRIADKVNTKKIVMIAILGFSTVFLTIGLAKKLPAFLLAGVLYGTFYGALGPIVQTWCVKTLGSGKSGTANSIYYTALDIGSGLGATIAGALASTIGYSRMYFVTIIPQLIVFTLVLLSALRDNKNKAK